MRSRLQDLKGRKVLLVASTGGHLTELHRLVHRLGLAADSHWVTFDTPQSRGLLADERVTFVPYIRPRDWKGIIRAAWRTRHLRRAYEGAVSTGAGLAMSVLPAMALRGKPALFIESISRVDGPSTTGQILRHLPRVATLTPHSWAAGVWGEAPSILGEYRLATPTATRPVRRVYVTLGTIKPYRFDRLVDLVAHYARHHPEVEVRWQLGSTTRDDLPGQVHAEMSPDDFVESIQWADVVVAHSGVGVTLNILNAGKVPVLLARSAQRDEHVDDHQQQIFDYLVRHGLAGDATQVLIDGALEEVASRRVEVETADPEVTDLRAHDKAPAPIAGTEVA